MRSKRDTLKRRVRKTVKWGGLVVTVLLLVVWIGSGWGYAAWANKYDSGMGVSDGRLYVGWKVSGLTPDQRRFTWRARQLWRLEWWFDLDTYRGGGIVGIPLWCPTLFSLLATGAAWRADAKYLRRARVGMCPACGYDRAGLAAGAVCPECGKQPEAR